jgi:hypothetical protein
MDRSQMCMLFVNSGREDQILRGRIIMIKLMRASKTKAVVCNGCNFGGMAMCSAYQCSGRGYEMQRGE